MMDRGFRRSGHVYYVPDCEGCRACEQIRVPVLEFRPSRTQRRVLRRNADVRVETGPPIADAARFEMFNRYQHARHDGRMACEMEEFERYVSGSPIETMEMSYWLGDRLVGVGLVDLCPDALSSVYFYHEPDLLHRSPGVFSSLMEIEFCRRTHRPYWYIGYYVAECSKMAYKAGFRPCELLAADGSWRRLDSGVSHIANETAVNGDASADEVAGEE